VQGGYVRKVQEYVDCYGMKRNETKPRKAAYNSDIGRVSLSLNPGVALETDMTSQKIYTRSYRTAWSYSQIP
jgi:hypothetical protein